MKSYWKIGILAATVIISVLALRYCTGIFDGGLAGHDRNRDGVRDDVEAFIEKEYGSNKRLHSVIRQLAKALQEEVEHPESADPIVGDKAMKCLRHIVGQDHVRSISILKAMESAVANTYPRIRAYIKYNARFNGKIITDYSGDLKSACAFDESIIQ